MKKNVIRYRNLKQALSLGLELIRIHRIFIFTQSPLLKQYVDLNINMRQQNKNDLNLI